MGLPAPVAAATAKLSALEAFHPRAFGVVLVGAALLLIASGLAPSAREAGSR
jgi:hypothetical protein